METIIKKEFDNKKKEIESDLTLWSTRITAVGADSIPAGLKSVVHPFPA